MPIDRRRPPISSRAAHLTMSAETAMEEAMMDSLTMGDARARYYERNQFGADGGDSLKWVPIKILGLTLYIPNTEGRRRAVRIHDLHHVVTGYQTTVRGEAEIAAWELASGCWQWPAAFVLNLGGLGLGAVLAPRRTARAWARGRKTRNLYGERGGIAHLLPRKVGELRAELGLDEPAPAPPVRARDALAVAAVGLPMAGVIAAVAAAPVIAAALLIAAIA
jgi:hypothetical protein